MRNQLKNTQLIAFKTLLDTKIERIDSAGFYTGEIINQYSSIETLRVVISYESGTYVKEQNGVVYTYEVSLQHTGQPVIVEGALIWLTSPTTSPADFQVNKVIPSLNSTKYILDTYQGLI